MVLLSDGQLLSMLESFKRGEYLVKAINDRDDEFARIANLVLIEGLKEEATRRGLIPS